MRSRLRKTFAALALTGVLVGGVAAIANAATGSPSPSTSSSSSSSSTSNNADNCPNM